MDVGGCVNGWIRGWLGGMVVGQFGAWVGRGVYKTRRVGWLDGLRHRKIGQWLERSRNAMKMVDFCPNFIPRRVRGDEAVLYSVLL